MARILIAWELGGGFGHILRYKTLITHLLDQGHRVCFAARDLASVRQVLAEQRLTLVQAPISLRNSGPVAEPIENYAYILHNTGFNDPCGLSARLQAWQFIYNSVQPDLVIFDHCPTGLLAARHYSFATLQCGNGFTTPPEISPFPALRESAAGPKALLKFEQRVLANANEALKACGADRLDRLQDLLRTDRTLLLTLEALDRYGDRERGEYIGPVFADHHGKPVNWSVGRQPRVFGYLKNTKSLPTLVATMKNQPAKTVIYAPEVGQKDKDRFGGGGIRFIDTPASLPASIRDCRFVINNGNLGTVLMALLTGVPLLLLPDTLEQYLNARCVEKLGAALIAGKQSDPGTISNHVQRLLEDDSYMKQARRFASEHRDFEPGQPTLCLIEAVDGLLQTRS
ncbi:hypothetical protein J2T55_002054 [Methylohalomonas lacus]|uniref:Erythromycin biosynthesis protein CIII-like C-terminal domain-containing protein n=1 Tax=Methylohalomonas lacus TaxID=398773 RepID=A0AAE3HNP2_9GAMM|nr:nucleotide disphospho-sugar-binding domain-containing protein [Methylohalomonas lacus]MCS3904022.1 hypothetical protein [Methylohalomonas lacus]